MGSFAGHALPGSLFLMFGIWCTVQITRRYIACKCASTPFYSTVAYPCICFCIQFAFEGTIKVCVTTVGMVAELIASTEVLRSGVAGGGNDFHGIYMGDIQHVSMYLFFFLSGIVDIVMNRKANVLPTGLDYFASAMAFTTEFILFKFHLHGQEPLETTLHTLLLYAAAGSVFSVVLEYNHPNSILLAYVRAYVVFLQGTWFYQIGFILYPQFPWQNHWDRTDVNNIMLATTIFNWHLVFVLLIMLITAGITYYISSRNIPVREGTAEYIWTKSRGNFANIYENESNDSNLSDEETVA